MSAGSIRADTRKRVFTVLAGAVLFACVWIWSERTTWERLLLSSNNRLMETAEVIALHTDTISAVAEQALAELTLQAKAAAQQGGATYRLAAEMNRLVRTSHLLGSISYVGPDGRLVSSTLDRSLTGKDVSEEDDFRFHRDNASSQARIGLPSRSRRGDGWFLPISQRINGPSNAFAGMLIVTINLEHLSRFIESFSLGGDNSFFLLRDDGALLMRFPLRARSMKAGLAEIEHFGTLDPTDIKGNREFELPDTGSSRLSGYYRSKQTGMTVIATRSKSALFHFWVTRSGYPWMGILAAFIGVVVISLRWIRQIRLRELGEQKIAAQELEFRLIANASTDIIEKIRLDGIRDYVSPAALSVLQQPPEALVGTCIFDGLDGDATRQWQAALLRLNAGSTSQAVLYQHTRPDGSTIWLESALSRVNNVSSDGPNAIVVITRDVTRQQIITQELDSLATTDELTGLFNKRHFNNRLSSMLAEARAQKQPISLLLIDLDRFKLFNDTYGHLAGDKALRAVADVIQARLQGTFGIAARYGGEELAVLLAHQNDMAVRAIAETIRSGVASLSIPHAGNVPFGHVTISIGHATMLPKSSTSENDLIGEADRALYLAKSNGRNRCQSHRELGETGGLKYIA